MASTLLPFLYHTRTILGANPRTTVAFVRSLHITSRRLQRKKDEIPFEAAFESAFSENNKDDKPPKKPTRASTITPTERRIFESIFADIEARGLQPAFQDDSKANAAANPTMSILRQAAQDAGRTRRASVSRPHPELASARERRKAVLRFPPQLRAAARRALEAMRPQTSKLSQGEDIAYDEASLAAGEDAYAEEDWQSSIDFVSRAVELEAKRHPERVRVEGLIASAKSDFELWDVLEKEVFTMPSRLGLVSGVPQKAGPRKRGRKKKIAVTDEMESHPEDAAAENIAAGDVPAEAIASEDITAEDIPADDMPAEAIPAGDISAEDIPAEDVLAEDVLAEDVLAEDVLAEDVLAAPDSGDALKKTSDEADTATVEDDAPPRELNLYIHGPLYPEYLLLALRRLDTAFRTPSTLAFSLLPRIKKQGLESYVLGVSTPFYNELLQIYWTRRGDLPTILALLDEMRRCGLSFDAQTASIMNHIERELALLGQKYGSFGRALLTMPGYESSVRDRVREWRRTANLAAREENVI